MPHRRIHGLRVIIDGEPLAPREGDSFHLWTMSYGEFLGYIGPDDSPVRRALAAPIAHVIAVPDASPPVRGTVIRVGTDHGAPDQPLFFRLDALPFSDMTSRA